MDKNTKKLLLATGLCLASAAVILFAPDLSFAGTGGTEFEAADTKITDIITGFGGKTVAGLSFGYAILRCMHKFDMVHVGTAFGVGLMASLGPSIIQSSITGLI